MSANMKIIETGYSTVCFPHYTHSNLTLCFPRAKRRQTQLRWLVEWRYVSIIRGSSYWSRIATNWSILPVNVQQQLWGLPCSVSWLYMTMRRTDDRQHSLPQHVTSAPSLPVFCTRLKTYFFELCYS